MPDLDGWTLAAIIAKAALYASSLLASGLILFLITINTRRDSIRLFVGRITVVSATGGLVFVFVRLGLQSGFLLDDGIRGMFDPQMVGIILTGPFGQSSIFLSLGLGMIISSQLLSTSFLWLGGLGTLLVAGSFSLTGHSLAEPRALLVILLVLHLLAVSFWLGILAPLYRLTDNAVDIGETVIVAETFGKQASFIIPVLLIAGTVLAAFLVGSFNTLFTSPYGWTLLVKLAAVGVLLSLATFNKLWLVPAIRSGDRNAQRKLRRSIQLETLVFMLIFLATATLTTTIQRPTAFRTSSSVCAFVARAPFTENDSWSFPRERCSPFQTCRLPVPVLSRH